MTPGRQPSPPDRHPMYVYENVTIDMERHLAFHHAHPDSPTRLTGQVHRFLRTLLRHPEWVYSYRDLADAVRPSPTHRGRHERRARDVEQDQANRHAMQVLASRVRAALGEAVGGPSIITNFTDEGYSIQQPIRIIHR